MKISVYSLSLKDKSPEQVIALAANYGCRIIEWWCRENGHLDRNNLEESARKIAALMKATGAQACALSPYFKYLGTPCGRAQEDELPRLPFPGSARRSRVGTEIEGRYSLPERYSKAGYARKRKILTIKIFEQLVLPPSRSTTLRWAKEGRSEDLLRRVAKVTKIAKESSEKNRKVMPDPPAAENAV